MANSDDSNDEEEETEWKNNFTDLTFSHASPSTVDGCVLNGPQTSPQRVVLHFDMDCFYAQVEMLRDPALRHLPLVTKLMSVVEAVEKCPQLVLVRGEDLSHYREFSYKVTELLASYCPLVERLGLDENYMDVTEMVEKRRTSCSSFKGHVYNHSGVGTDAGDHQRLALGSHIAAELRAAIAGSLGLTGCAGVATNKLLAKLVSGTFKPNQQTTLLPEDVDHVMLHLGGLRRLPGVGHQTGKRLQALGLVSVLDLQLFPLADLVKEFGGPTGQRLKNLSLGVDESPVTPTGPPQSLSDEDSFKRISTTREVIEKARDLLNSLLERMQKDGRQPQTFRLTIRKYSADNKWFSRESRQCPVPNHLGQKITSASSDAAAHLVTMAMKLFHKMVEGGAAFHLTLLNVCFSNLLPRGPAAAGRGAITSFFTHGTSPRKNSPIASQEQPSGGPGHESGCEEEGRSMQMIAQHHVPVTTDQADTKSPVSAVTRDRWGVTCNTQAPAVWASAIGGGTFKLPPNIDPEVFRELPEDIQRELLSPAPPASSGTATTPPPARPPTSRPPPHSPNESHQLPGREESPTGLRSSDVLPTTTQDGQMPAGTTCIAPGKTSGADTQRAAGGGHLAPPPDCSVPGDVDPAVFSELPPDVQRELMAAWRQQNLVLKAPSSSTSSSSPSSPPSSSVKPERKSLGTDKKVLAKSRRQSDLFKYFKPS
ncbi:hypothetical protein NHX12_029077 [Muraenolepis orangiensis]|uniref:UmuC domain-containing protein n=1 Tax=Muraenolepis orangiensis TaxID=630683 RepID=A0A9Q0EEJ4_9TELE|nr:hypothetical protein NHX12_029077 [Muraenolepis orangiensis]